MPSQDLVFFYQLQHLDAATLESRNFKLAVVDDDDAKLSRDNISLLNSQGKSLLAYASAGEAETYRDYWRNGQWGVNPPSFIIDQNPNFATGFRVKFWEDAWQQVVLTRVESLAREGYSGVYLDVVDVYNVPSVRAAYQAAFPGGDIRKAAEDFVVRISEYAKSLNPDFKIVVQNAVGLLNQTELANYTEPLTPNTRFLNAIDGIGKESTFAFRDTFPLPWTEGDARYTQNATNAGKFVIGLEYPTSASAQNYSLSEQLDAGYIPYFDTQLHDGNFLAINYDVASLVSPTLVALAAGNPLAGTALIGTEAGDRLIGNGYADIIYGYAGADTIYGLEGNDNISGGDGNDIAFGWEGNDRLVGGAGNDSLFGDQGNDTVVGGAGDDGLYGWTGNDSLDGGAGNDFLMGEQGVDTIIGGDGADTIYAGSENDIVYGDDSIASSATGNDYILLDDGNDVGAAGSGADTVFGGSGNDTILAGDGNDFIGGDVGNDSIMGDAGNDTLFGWTGDDSLFGGSGNDLLSGEDGIDRLDGGTGNDTLYGGASNDHFVYAITGGFDVIADFVRGQDIIDITGAAGQSFATLIAPHLSYSSGNAIISFSADHSLTLTNIGSGLTASDFTFI